MVRLQYGKHNKLKPVYAHYVIQTVTALSNTNPVEKGCGKVSLTCGILPTAMCKQSLVNQCLLNVSYL